MKVFTNWQIVSHKKQEKNYLKIERQNVLSCIIHHALDKSAKLSS